MKHDIPLDIGGMIKSYSEVGNVLFYVLEYYFINLLLYQLGLFYTFWIVN